MPPKSLSPQEQRHGRRPGGSVSGFFYALYQQQLLQLLSQRVQSGRGPGCLGMLLSLLANTIKQGFLSKAHPAKLLYLVHMHSLYILSNGPSLYYYLWCRKDSIINSLSHTTSHNSCPAAIFQSEEWAWGWEFGCEINVILHHRTTISIIFVCPQNKIKNFNA